MKKAGMLTAMVVLGLVAMAGKASAAVPELDPGAASTGIALLAGGLLLLNGRRPKR